MPAPRPRQISDILPRLQNVAQTSQYLVKFQLPVSSLRSFLRRKGVNDRFIADDIGLLCSEAVLPGSALASVDTRGDYQGVIERFAHTRNFTQINLQFYVDNSYKSMKFIEHWMEYITGAIEDPSRDTYHFKLHYPSEYKSNETRIVKFERDHNRFLEYRFVGLFPLSLSSTKVSYQGSQVLKASANFSFDRYICGESNSLSRALRTAFNEIFNQGNPARDGFSVSDNELAAVFRARNQVSESKKDNLTDLYNGSASYPVQTLSGNGLGIGMINPGGGGSETNPFR